MAIYSDLNGFNPTEKPILTDVECIYQSIFNILNTRKGERLFEPEFGTDFDDELFELMDDLGALSLLKNIIDSINRWEKRVVIDYSSTKVVPIFDEHRYELTLVFNIVGIENTKFEYIGSITK